MADKLYRMDVKVWATAYIKASSREEAFKLAEAELRNACVGIDASDEVSTSEARLEDILTDAEHPAVTLSPVGSVEWDGADESELEVEIGEWDED